MVKVHLTPKIFFFAKKKYSCFEDYLFEKFLPCRSTENQTEIATILAHDRVFRIKGLVTTVTSLQELNNLYFAPFHTVCFHMFGRLDQY